MKRWQTTVCPSNPNIGHVKVAQLCLTLCNPMNYTFHGILQARILEWVAILFCPILLLPSIFPSIRVFSNESALHIRWPKYWSFSISPSNEYSGLISFRIDSFDLLTVQGTLRSLIQHHNLKASILHHSTFFMVQLSHPYMTTGKTIALTIWKVVNKVTSLL